ncbi:hypothetical protein Nepgr_000633 [Nepenthes gracilis]|uniref:Uncharacterized protein n=1 Tax=Nepenthes gracilis TaxID=150966 RepID=A0AAD3P6S1_NEPGR|nr:hypothetical protein Nepgr_000633 [Nepenthes gracilis]
MAGGMKFSFAAALLIALVAAEAAVIHAQGRGNNNNRGHNNGNRGNSGNRKKRVDEAAVTQYTMLTAVAGTKQERAFCRAKGRCFYRTLTCPEECPKRKPKNRKQKACFIDCSSTCQATCKRRVANCNGYGSLCYDPRLVGGDGVMFYFHGSKGKDFAILSDDNLQINAHLIGTRPTGRTRDFTWVQALALMFDSHTLTVAAKTVPHWNTNLDALLFRWDGEDLEVPRDGEAEWRMKTEEREVVVERTDETNSVRVTVTGLLEMDVNVRPIGEEENRVHSYRLPANDSFAHLETQFKFYGLTDSVDGILGKTYRPGFVSPVKRGVAMPIMGGEDKYQTKSLYSPFCKLCRFNRRPSVQSATTAMEPGLAQF